MDHPDLQPLERDMPENTALWLPSKRAAFQLGSAAFPTLRPGTIVVRVRAIAVNPFERVIQAIGDIITSWIQYPMVLGSDVAGDVAAVGDGVSRFRPGDRVVGFAAGSEKSHNTAEEGAYQHYVLLEERLCAPLPSDISYEKACVIPLGVATAASALFQSDQLALSGPTAEATDKDETILVWGGSSSVGSNAIQLAVAAGYDVLATASPRNFEYVKRLGARAAFDYRSANIVEDLIAAFQGREAAGAIAIGKGSTRGCIDVLAKVSGKRFVAMVTPPTSFDDVPRGRGRLRKLLPALARMIFGNLILATRARRNGVRTKFVWGGAPVDNKIGPLIFEHFLPDALAEGRFVPAPDARLIGQGLKSIPRALEQQRLGVSAQKLVVTL